MAAGNIGVPMIEAVTGGLRGRGGRGVVLPAAVHRDLPARGQLLAQPGPGSSRLASDPRPLRRRPRPGSGRTRRVGDTAVFNADDPSSVAAAAAQIPVGVDRVTFGLGRAGLTTGSSSDRLVDPGGRDGHPDSPSLPRALPHDLANALAAAAVATAAGATRDRMPARVGEHPAAAASGQPGRFGRRGRLVRRFQGDYAGVGPGRRWPGFSSVVLIAGGRNKGLDLTALRATVPPVRAVVAIGEAAGDVGAAFSGLAPVTTPAAWMRPWKRPMRLAHPGDAVVLSPGLRQLRLVPVLCRPRRPLRFDRDPQTRRRRGPVLTSEPRAPLTIQSRLPPEETLRLAGPKRRASTARPASRRGLTYWVLVALVAILCLIGVVMVLSASSIVSLQQFGSPWYFFERQLMWLAIGTWGSLVAVRIDPARWRRLAPRRHVPHRSASFSRCWSRGSACEPRERRGGWEHQSMQIATRRAGEAGARSCLRPTSSIDGRASATGAIRWVPVIAVLVLLVAAGHGPTRHGHGHRAGLHRGGHDDHGRDSVQTARRPAAEAERWRPRSSPSPLRTAGGG